MADHIQPRSRERRAPTAWVLIGRHLRVTLPVDVPFVTFVAMACKRSGVQIPSAPPRTPGQTIRRWQDVQLSWVRVRTPARELMRRTGLEARIGAGNFHLRVEDAVAAFRGHS